MVDLISILPVPDLFHRKAATIAPVKPAENHPEVLGDRISAGKLPAELPHGCKILKPEAAQKPEHSTLFDIMEGKSTPVIASYPQAKFDKFFKDLEDNFAEIDVNGDGKINLGEIMVYEQTKMKNPSSEVAFAATDVLNPDLLKRQFTREELTQFKKDIHDKIASAAGDDQILTREEGKLANKELNKMFYRPGYIEQQENLPPPNVITDKARGESAQTASFK
jgi:hypothetical protein